VPRHGNAPGAADPAGREGNDQPARILARELSPEAVQRQVEALAAYIARGGQASLWLDGKGFLAADRGAILTAWGDFENGDAA
jgi:hypothetical protein